MDTDRIVKTKVLRVSRARVWQALSDSAKFGEWFGFEFSGAFQPGARLEGKITNRGYEHLRATIEIERVEPQWLLSWRWHPNAVDPGKDYSNEPKTLVSFELSDVSDGTLLTVTESGFDKIPAKDRKKAFKENESGWTKQLDSITRYLSRAA